MKRLTLVLAIMVTGLSFAQDLSSVTATATAKSYDKAGNGVWTNTPDGIVFRLHLKHNTINNFNTVLDKALEILENNKEDISDLDDYTSDAQIANVTNRYKKEFDNLFELTKRGGGLLRAYEIIGSDNTIHLYIMLQGDDYLLLIKTI